MDFGADLVKEISQLEQRAQGHDLVKTLEVGGDSFQYKVLPGQHGRTLGEVVAPPRAATITVKTLSGLLDGITHCALAKPEDCVLKVEDELNVLLMGKAADIYGHRQVHIKATHDPLKGLAFNEIYKDLQKFVIGLQVQFLVTQELMNLIKLVGNLKTDEGIQVEDDGFSQRVTIKSGQVTAHEHTIEPRIKLIPWRTFPEVNPVVTEFLIRFKNLDGAPGVGLYEIDGGKWKQETMVAIKKHLTKELDETKIPILA